MYVCQPLSYTTITEPISLKFSTKMADELKRNIKLTLLRICSYFQDSGHLNDIVHYLNLKKVVVSIIRFFVTIEPK